MVIQGLRATSRTLILTHLRGPETRSLNTCTRLWNLRDKAFVGLTPFAKKLSIVEEGSRLPLDAIDSFSSLKAFSLSGALDDPAPDFAHKYFDYEFFTPENMGFPSKGDNFFIMGGGNLDFCLFRTFESLVKIKKKQGEPLFVAIPTGAVYASSRVPDIFEYFGDKNNRYGQFLRNSYESLGLSGYRIFYDGRLTDSGGQSGEVELHFFSSTRDMFASPLFFPELNQKSSWRIIMDHFKM